MARGHARIHTTIWTNRQFVKLSGQAQRTYLLALSQPNLSYCGVVPYTAKRWALLAGDSTPNAIAKAVRELEEHRFVMVDPATEELLIRTFIRHDGVFKSPNIIRAMVKDLVAVMSDPLRAAVVEGFPEGFEEGFAKAFPEGLPEPLAELLTEPVDEGFAEPQGEPSPHASVRTRAPVRARLPSPYPSPPPQPSPPGPVGRGDATANGAGDGAPAGRREAPQGPEQVLADTWDRLARFDLTTYRNDGGRVTSVDGFLKTARQNRIDESDARARAELAASPTLDAVGLAELLDARCGPDDHGAARARREHEATTARLEADRADFEARRAEEARRWAVLEALPPDEVAVLRKQAEADVPVRSEHLIRGRMLELFAERHPTESNASVAPLGEAG